jgi:transposase
MFLEWIRLGHPAIARLFLVACVMTGSLDAEPKIRIRKFGTIVAELELLRDWLVGEGCSHAVMESTGSYWTPIFNVLEDSLGVVLANAYDVQKPARPQNRSQ